MHLDVIDLRSFYYRTQLGRHTKHVLQARVGALWPDTQGETVVGFGFAAPLLRPLMGGAAHMVCLMPGAQGVMPWPMGAQNISVLCEETQWPLEAASADRIVVAHGLETCDAPGALLDEVWRVLAPGGRVLFMVPNRAGLWARRDATPFGYGRPYSTAQLEEQLRAHRFTPERHEGALYAMPSHKRFWLRLFAPIEAFGTRSGVGFVAGALLIEASKQIYATPRGGHAARISRPLQVLEGLATPAHTQPSPTPSTTRGQTRLLHPETDSS